MLLVFPLLPQLWTPRTILELNNTPLSCTLVPFAHWLFPREHPHPERSEHQSSRVRGAQMLAMGCQHMRGH